MGVPELNIAPRTRGRAQKAGFTAALAGELTPADLRLLEGERKTAPPSIVALRDRHHALARCLASGMTNTEASLHTGYDASRISILKGDPAFQALMDDYRSLGASAEASFVERAKIVSFSALNRIQDALEDEANPVNLNTAIEIVKLTADRTGHAPVQRNVNLNVNSELGTRLSAARRRLEAARLEPITVLSPGGDTDEPSNLAAE